MAERYPFQSLKLSIAAICEYAIESRGRWTLVGTFRRLEFERFPATLDRMEVYLLFTDVTRAHLNKVAVGLHTDLATPPFIYLSTVASPSANPHEWEAAFVLHDVVFRQPGKYDLAVEVEDDVFEVVILHVREQK
jgi:hypothetical protein